MVHIFKHFSATLNHVHIRNSTFFNERIMMPSRRRVVVSSERIIAIIHELKTILSPRLYQEKAIFENWI
jgi:hypothetical protein